MVLKISDWILECGFETTASAQDSSLPVAEAGGQALLCRAPPAKLDGIAEAVMTGRMGQREAVEEVLADALSSPVSSAIPSESRRELAELLEALLTEDPYLGSLARAISQR